MTDSILEDNQMRIKPLCDICGREGHEWTAHMNQITKETGFGLWERAEGGFICGCCNKISPKPTRFCGYCGKWFTGVLLTNGCIRLS